MIEHGCGTRIIQSWRVDDETTVERIMKKTFTASPFIQHTEGHPGTCTCKNKGRSSEEYIGNVNIMVGLINIIITENTDAKQADLTRLNHGIPGMFTKQAQQYYKQAVKHVPPSAFKQKKINRLTPCQYATRDTTGQLWIHDFQKFTSVKLADAKVKGSLVIDSKVGPFITKGVFDGFWSREVCPDPATRDQVFKLLRSMFIEHEPFELKTTSKMLVRWLVRVCESYSRVLPHVRVIKSRGVTRTYFKRIKSQSNKSSPFVECVSDATKFSQVKLAKYVKCGNVLWIDMCQHTPDILHECFG
jgi:hypothetical protein